MLKVLYSSDDTIAFKALFHQYLLTPNKILQEASLSGYFLYNEPNDCSSVERNRAYAFQLPTNYL